MISDFKDLLRIFAEHHVEYLLPDFSAAWNSSETATAEGIPLHYLGKSDLIRAKQAAGRLQDLADIEELRRANAD